MRCHQAARWHVNIKISLYERERLLSTGAATNLFDGFVIRRILGIEIRKADPVVRALHLKASSLQES